jgi:hypothetical protein
MNDLIIAIGGPRRYGAESHTVQVLLESVCLIAAV